MRRPAIPSIYKRVLTAATVVVACSFAPGEAKVIKIIETKPAPGSLQS